MDYMQLMESITKSKEGFMTSSKTTCCIYCGADILPQDNWLPGIPEFNLQTEEFEYPAVAYHAMCEDMVSGL